VIHGIEERHPEHEVRHHQGAGESQIDAPQQSRRRGDPGSYLVGRNPGGLGEEQLRAADPEQGQDRDPENDDSHSADPVGKAAPQQNRGRKLLDHRENRGPGRREAGYRFEQSTGDGRCDSGGQERKRTDRDDGQPRQTDDGERLARVELGASRREDPQHGPERARYRHREEPCPGQVFADPDHGRRNHRQGHRDQEPAE